MQIAKLFKHEGLWYCQMSDNPALCASGNDVVNAVHNLNQRLETADRDPLPLPLNDRLPLD